MHDLPGQCESCSQIATSAMGKPVTIVHGVEHKPRSGSLPPTWAFVEQDDALVRYSIDSAQLQAAIDGHGGKIDLLVPQ